MHYPIPKTKQQPNKQKTNPAKHNIKNKTTDHNTDKPLNLVILSDICLYHKLCSNLIQCNGQKIVNNNSHYTHKVLSLSPCSPLYNLYDFWMLYEIPTYI